MPQNKQKNYYSWSRFSSLVPDYILYRRRMELSQTILTYRAPRGVYHSICHVSPTLCSEIRTAQKGLQDSRAGSILQSHTLPESSNWNSMDRLLCFPSKAYEQLVRDCLIPETSTGTAGSQRSLLCPPDSPMMDSLKGANNRNYWIFMRGMYCNVESEL